MKSHLRLAPAPDAAFSDPFDLSPRLRELLAERGFRSDRRQGEADAAFRDRLDTGLMALFRDTRDPEVFDSLYEHARGRVVLWLRGLLAQHRSALDPVELLQDTFVNVFRYSRRFRSEHSASFRVWVRTIAANALRRAQAGTLAGSLQELSEGLQDPIDRRPEPARRIVEVEEGRSLRMSWLIFLDHYGRAYGELSPRDRRALELVEVRGLSYSEAGAELRVGSSNMKMIMFRSRQRIQLRMRRSMGLERARDQRLTGRLLTTVRDAG
jgi:RNA polymerase sigma factor (sigma-70 family)